ncbi:MAG: hypothetical protein KDA61_18350, partial [Planctomycetales bacterium]|nr:hypothetical protein [Planctomycetales bacterium]
MISEEESGSVAPGAAVLPSKTDGTPVQPLRGWLRKLRRRRPSLSPQAMVVLAASLVRGVVGRLPQPEDEEPSSYVAVRSNLRMALRVVNVFHSDGVLTAVCKILERGDGKTSSRLKQVWEQAQRLRKERGEAKVEIAEMMSLLRKFGDYLSADAGQAPPSLHVAQRKQTKGRTPPQRDEQIHAYCSGAREVYLPPSIATTKFRRLNELMFFYLLAHEIGHLAVGSFDFQLKNVLARSVKRLLARRRRDGHEPPPRRVASAELSAKLKAEGIDIHQVRRGKTPDLIWVFQHFATPRIARDLFNALEDARVETYIREYWPGLAEIASVHEPFYATHHYPSPKLVSAWANFLNGIAAIATGRLFPHEIAAELEPTFAQARTIVERFLEKPNATVYDSTLATMQILELIENEASPETQIALESTETEICDSGERWEISLEEQLYRAERARQEQQSKDLSIDGLRAGGPERDWDEPGEWTREVVAADRKGEVRYKDDAVLVVQRKFEPYLATRPLELPAWHFPGTGAPAEWVKRRHARQWSPDGAEIAEDRLATFWAELQRGQVTSSIFYDAKRREPNLEVVVLVDLTISMETRHQTLSGRSSADAAVQIVRWLAHNLRNRRVPLRVFGVHDGGRRPVAMYEVSAQSDAALAALHPIGIGGCRLGACLRAIARRPLPAGRRRMVFALTDGASIYSSPGTAESLIHQVAKKNCPNCSRRHDCTVEPRKPVTGIVSMESADF